MDTTLTRAQFEHLVVIFDETIKRISPSGSNGKLTTCLKEFERVVGNLAAAAYFSTAGAIRAALKEVAREDNPTTPDSEIQKIMYGEKYNSLIHRALDKVFGKA